MVLMASAYFGCAGKNAGPEPAHMPAPVEEQAPAEKRSPGSLYSNASGSLFAPNKATREGDILTVVIYEQASAAKEAQTSTGRSSNASLGIPKLFGVETSVADKNVRALIEGARARGQTVRIGGTLFSDAMGPAGTYEGTYIGMIDHNVTTITRALGGEAPEQGLHGMLSGH